MPLGYLDFGDPVPFRGGDGVIERGVLSEDGRISGRTQSAVRAISADDFARIIDRGIAMEDGILPRVGDPPPPLGFQEPQTPFQTFQDRERIDYLGSRTVRDRNFRRVVLRAYDERCAITGLRLIKGGGRAEVEAAHIRPVKESGPDIVSNGIALSGTAHWMFDRGLLGLADDLTILVSRQINDPDAVRAMINNSGYLITPKRASDRPHPYFTRWHREHRFKL